MSDALDRLLRGCRHVTLGVGAVVGALCVLTALTGVVLDVHPLVFRSGSMAPTIDTGALALVHRVDSADLDPGDIVSVPTESGSRVTHRIVQVTHGERGATLQLKGDANLTPDARLYDVQGADLVLFSLPRVGYVIGWLTGAQGRFLLGLFAAFLVVVLLRRGEHHGRRRAAPRLRSRARARVLTIASAALVLVAAGGVRATPGWAAWNDGATVSGTTMGAHAVQPPNAVNCSASTPSATMSWSETDPRYDYEVVLKRAADASVVSTRQVTGAGVLSTYSGGNDFGLPSLVLGTYDYTVEVRSYLTLTPSWRSSGVTVGSQKIRVLVAGVITPLIASVTCV